MSCQERKVRFSRHSQESSGAGINEVGDAGVSCIQFQVLWKGSETDGQSSWRKSKEKTENEHLEKHWRKMKMIVFGKRQDGMQVLFKKKKKLSKLSMWADKNQNKLWRSGEILFAGALKTGLDMVRNGPGEPLRLLHCSLLSVHTGRHSCVSRSAYESFYV